MISDSGFFGSDPVRQIILSSVADTTLHSTPDIETDTAEMSSPNLLPNMVRLVPPAVPPIFGETSCIIGDKELSIDKLTSVASRFRRLIIAERDRNNKLSYKLIY